MHAHLVMNQSKTKKSTAVCSRIAIMIIHKETHTNGQKTTKKKRYTKQAQEKNQKKSLREGFCK